MKPLSPMARYVAFLVLVAAVGFGLIAACAKLFGAQERAVVDAPQMHAFTAIPLYRPDGSLKQLSVLITYRVMMQLPDGKGVEPHLKTESADFVVSAGQLLPIGDTLVEFGDLAEDMMASSDFIWFLNNPRQLSPDRPTLERRKQVPKGKRKVLREPAP